MWVRTGSVTNLPNEDLTYLKFLGFFTFTTPIPFVLRLLQRIRKLGWVIPKTFFNEECKEAELLKALHYSRRNTLDCLPMPQPLPAAF